MTQHFPRKTRISKAGSNRTDAQASIEEKRLEVDSRNNAYRKAQTAFMRQRNKILTGKAVRRAVPIFRDQRNKFAHAFLESNGDVDRIMRTKKKARKSIDSALLRTIPKYKQYLSIKKSYLENHRVLFNKEVLSKTGNQVAIDLGDKAVSDDLEYQEFTPTYELFEVFTHDFQNLVRYDESFVEPQSGILVNNIRFNHDEDDWSLYNPTGWAFTEARLGINYQVAKTGYLTCSIIIQNLYNKIAYSVKDNFGFSHANLDIFQSLLIDVVRSGETTRFPRNMVAAGLVSHGANLSYSTSEIQNSTPFTISFTTKDAFLQGEQIQILAGSRILIRSDLDDMESYVDAVLMWQLKKIFVGT